MCPCALCDAWRDALAQEPPSQVKLTVLVAISDPRTIVARRLENDCRLSDPANPSELYCSSPLALCYHKSRGNSEGGTMIQNKVSYGRQPSTSLDTQVMHEEFRCQVHDCYRLHGNSAASTLGNLWCWSGTTRPSLWCRRWRLRTVKKRDTCIS